MLIALCCCWILFKNTCFLVVVVHLSLCICNYSWTTTKLHCSNNNIQQQNKKINLRTVQSNYWGNYVDDFLFIHKEEEQTKLQQQQHKNQSSVVHSVLIILVVTVVGFFCWMFLICQLWIHNYRRRTEAEMGPQSNNNNIQHTKINLHNIVQYFCSEYLCCYCVILLCCYLSVVCFHSYRWTNTRWYNSNSNNNTEQST